MIIVPNGLLWTFICRQTYLETWCYCVPKLLNFFVVFGAQILIVNTISWSFILLYALEFRIFINRGTLYNMQKKLRKKLSFRDVTEILHLEWNILEDVMIPDHRKWIIKIEWFLSFWILRLLICLEGNFQAENQPIDGISHFTITIRMQ